MLCFSMQLWDNCAMPCISDWRVTDGCTGGDVRCISSGSL